MELLSTFGDWNGTRHLIATIDVDTISVLAAGIISKPVYDSGMLVLRTSSMLDLLNIADLFSENLLVNINDIVCKLP